MTFSNRHFFIFTIAMMFIVGFSTTAQAQFTPQNNAPAGLAAIGAGADTGTLSGLDTRGFNTATWAALSKSQVLQLRSDDDLQQENALQNIIFFATHHGEDVDFSNIGLDLYNIYRFDRNEERRVMALAAIHAIGRENTMRLLNQHLPWERSARVRRLTKAALLDYFGPAD